MNLKKQNRIITNKRSAALQPGDVFRYIADDIVTCRVLSRDGVYVRYEVLEWKQTFTSRHYDIADAKGFKILGKYKSTPVLKIITFGIKKYKIINE